MQILDEIVPDLVIRRGEEEKKQRVAQRLQRQMGNVLLDLDGGFGRCLPSANPSSLDRQLIQAAEGAFKWIPCG